MENVIISLAIVPFHRQGQLWGHLAVLYPWLVELGKPVCL